MTGSHIFAIAANDGPPPDPALLGSKGAGLIAMAGLGLPVPSGFILDTALGRAMADGNQVLPDGVRADLQGALAALEKDTGRVLGGSSRPLLVSVRSGAAASMPGMMDTVLNLGLNDGTVDALAEETGDERFAWDTYRRFFSGFSNIVFDLSPALFEEIAEDILFDAASDHDQPASPEQLRLCLKAYHDLFQRECGDGFPQDAREQLDLALLAVFRSWNTPRAVHFRQINNLSNDDGTAAVVQAMVFGNRGEGSCTGVYFTRNPSTGEADPYGEYIPNAQGEDIVCGIRTPFELTEAGRIKALSPEASLEGTMPDIFNALIGHGEMLEHHFGEMQEIEFTVEEGRLYLLQTRAGKRSARASLRIAVDMVRAGIISQQTATQRIDRAALDAMLVPTVAAPAGEPALARGLPASPGVASGAVVFSSQDAVEARQRGEETILLRPETDPRDIHGMDAAAGIVTTRGGMTSHAAVVARGMGKPCITAAMGLKIDPQTGVCRGPGVTINAGDVLTIDGKSGFVYAGKQPMVKPEPDGDLKLMLEWIEAQDATDQDP